MALIQRNYNAHILNVDRIDPVTIFVAVRQVMKINDPSSSL